MHFVRISGIRVKVIYSISGNANLIFRTVGVVTFCLDDLLHMAKAARE